MFLQRTIRKKVEVVGIGLHTGAKTSLTFCPAPANTGIHFVRKDLLGDPSVAAHADFVRATGLATTLGCDEFSVATVEHCLSTLAAYRIDNLTIELGGPEIPIGDGSAKVFLDALMSVGFVEQDQPRSYAYITEPISYQEGDKFAHVVPYNGLRVTCSIDFSHPKIGLQKLDIDVNETTFFDQIASARTFGFARDVEQLHARGLALGANLTNAIGLDQTEVLNAEGLRYADEFVRHKVLDALGDLVTLGMPMMGHLVSYKAGHDIMNKLVKKILASPKSYRRMELGTDINNDLNHSAAWRYKYA